MFAVLPITVNTNLFSYVFETTPHDSLKFRTHSSFQQSVLDVGNFSWLRVQNDLADSALQRSNFILIDRNTHWEEIQRSESVGGEEGR